MERRRFPDKLKSFRQRAGYSRKVVAGILGHADTSTLCEWEMGRLLPKLLQAFQLAKLYGVLPHELFGELWQQIGKNGHLFAHNDEPFNSNQ